MGAITLALLLLLLPSVILCSVELDISYYKTYTLPNNTVGPSYISFANDGISAFTGISNGDIVKFSLITGSFTPFAWEPNRNGTLCDHNSDPNLLPVCGLPLGLSSNGSGYLYFCDLFKGLYGVGPSGGEATPLVASAGGLPVFACDAVEVDNNGTVYFTDSSQMYRQLTLQISNNDTTGRLLKYEPHTGEVTVLATGLGGPKGIAISSDSSYILVSLAVNSTILKYHLTGTEANTIETFVSNISRPLNVRRSWIGDIYYVLQNPVPFVHTLALIDSTGAVQQNVSITGPYSDDSYITDVQPYALQLYIGSPFVNFLGEAIIVQI